MIEVCVDVGSMSSRSEILLDVDLKEMRSLLSKPLSAALLRRGGDPVDETEMPVSDIDNDRSVGLRSFRLIGPRLPSAPMSR